MPQNEIDVFVGERLRAFRLSRRMSLEELGRRVGVSYQQMQKYELGTNRVSASQMWRLSRALQIDVGAFFPLGEDPEAQAHARGIAIGRLDPAIRSAITELIEAIAAAETLPSTPAARLATYSA